MRPSWIVVALCALSLDALPAQDVSSTKEWIRREVEEKQRLMREGKVVRNNVRITVRLRNGSRILGVVKNGRFIERHDGLAFVPSDRTADGSGLRLWYYDQTNSYVFLPWETIAEHTIGEVLTDEEVAQMGLELDRTARQAREAREKVAPLQPPGAPPVGGPTATPPAAAPGGGAGTEDASKAKAPELTEAQRALLAEFPPEAGWGLDRMKQLEARKFQVGVFPNEKEKRFLDNFGAWSEAYQRYCEARPEASGNGGLTPVVVTTTPAKGGAGDGGGGTGARPAPPAGGATPPGRR